MENKRYTIEELFNSTEEMLGELSGHDISFITGEISSRIAASDEMESRRLAAGGIRLLERIAALDPAASFDRELSAMHFCLNYLLHHGIPPQEPLLQPSRMLHWAFSQLPPYTSLKDEAENWRSLPVEEMLRLRRYKNRLKIVEELRESGLAEVSEEQSLFLALRPLLP